MNLTTWNDSGHVSTSKTGKKKNEKGIIYQHLHAGSHRIRLLPNFVYGLLHQWPHVGDFCPNLGHWLGVPKRVRFVLRGARERKREEEKKKKKRDEVAVMCSKDNNLDRLGHSSYSYSYTRQLESETTR